MNQIDKNFSPCDTDILLGEPFMENFLSTYQVRQIMKGTARYVMLSAKRYGDPEPLREAGAFREEVCNSKWKQSARPYQEGSL